MYPDNHYGYTHFCNLFKAWQRRIHVPMRINHKAGEKLFLDFSGLKLEIIDKITGEAIEADILVATLAASGYTYAKATRDQTTRSLIADTINALEYFDGVTELFVPDNIKAAVKKECASRMLEAIRKLHHVEKETSLAKLSFEDRYKLRREKSAPVLVDIKDWLQKK
jgi:transposase